MVSTLCTLYINNLCLPYISEPLNFLGARKFCQDQGKDIAVATDDHRLNKILKLFKEKVKEPKNTPADSWIFAGFNKNFMGQWRDVTTNEMLVWDDNWSLGDYVLQSLLYRI